MSTVADPLVIPGVAMNAELEKAIAEATDPASVRAVIMAEAERQLSVVQDAAAAAAKVKSDAAEAAATAAALHESTKEFIQTEVINGKTFDFVASSELELARKVSDAYRVASAFQPEKAAAVAGPDPMAATVAAAAAAKIAEQQVAARAALEVQFKNGTISVSDYIEKSGAVEAYLAKQGLPITALQSAVERDQNDKFTNAWVQATDDFVHTHADWPGGENNKQVLGLQVAALGLVESEDRAAALDQAWTAMKASGVIFKNEPVAAVVAAPAVAAVVPAAVAVVVPPARTAAQSSSLFNRSSGNLSAPAADKKVEPTTTIPANATPAEIIDAWKKAQVDAGQDPNAVFMAQFKTHRI